MFADVCSVCRSSKVVEGYKETTLIRTVRNEEKTMTKKWCQDCLTEYANKHGIPVVPVDVFKEIYLK